MSILLSWFYLTQNNGFAQCYPCPQYCQECQMSNNAIKCTSVQQGFLLNVGNSTFLTGCDQGCLNCNQTLPSMCLECSSGYVLNSKINVCQPCPASCKECYITEYNGSLIASIQCSICFSNAIWTANDQTCTPCTPSSNCLTCLSEDLDSCTACPTGYNLGSDQQCISGCPALCQACSGGTACITCVEGYGINNQEDQTCVPCLSTCKLCSGSNPSACIQCGSGLSFDPLLNPMQRNCNQCPDYCSKCQTYASDYNNGQAVCQECFPGFALTKNFTCIRQCQAPCATCSSISPTVCTSCLAGYLYDSAISACVPMTSCDGGCKVCPEGYVLNNGQCIQCANANCSRCLPNNTELCTVCKTGMYLFTTNSICLSCPQGCKTCSSPSFCTSCSSGYTINYQGVGNSLSKCVACSQKCAECFGNPLNCISCADGYFMLGRKCVSDAYFSISLTLGVDLDFFNQNYFRFLIQLLGIGSIEYQSGAGFDNISINTLYGAGNMTFLSLYLMNSAMSNQQQGSKVYSRLIDGLSNSNNIGPMPILNSVISVYGASLSPDEDPDDLFSSSISVSLLFIILVISFINQ